MNQSGNRKVVAMTVLGLGAILTPLVYSHCQLPCGIYGDEARIKMITEHITTIEKSMRLINMLSQEPKSNMNQIVRWVQNKENHADELTEIITYYFMAQRIKPVEKTNQAEYQKYITQLTLLHEMMIVAMKAKQTTDVENIIHLKELLSKFEVAYLGHTH